MPPKQSAKGAKRKRSTKRSTKAPKPQRAGGDAPQRPTKQPRRDGGGLRKCAHCPSNAEPFSSTDDVVFSNHVRQCKVVQRVWVVVAVVVVAK